MLRQFGQAGGQRGLAMERGLDWYKRDPIAFLDAIQGLGPELIGAYAVIIDLLYARSGETMRDDRHLSGIMGCSIRKATALTDQLLDLGKITFHDGFITNSRAKSEAKSKRQLSEVRSEHGRTGGENSAISRENKRLAEALAASKVQAEKRREEESIKKERVSPTALVSEDTIDQDFPSMFADQKEPVKKTNPLEHFQDFWDAYPHRNGKKSNRGGAEKKFAAAIKAGVTIDQIAAGVSDMMRDPDVGRGFGRMAETWLNQKGWQDEIPTEGTQNGQPNRNQNGNARVGRGTAEAAAAVAEQLVNNPGGGHNSGW